MEIARRGRFGCASVDGARANHGIQNYCTSPDSSGRRAHTHRIHGRALHGTVSLVRGFLVSRRRVSVVRRGEGPEFRIPIGGPRTPGPSLEIVLLASERLILESGPIVLPTAVRKLLSIHGPSPFAVILPVHRPAPCAHFDPDVAARPAVLRFPDGKHAGSGPAVDPVIGPILVLSQRQSQPVHAAIASLRGEHPRALGRRTGQRDDSRLVSVHQWRARGPSAVRWADEQR